MTANTPAASKPPDIYVDADACPVRAEVFRVAQRYALKVYVVANAFISVPSDPRIERVLVGDGFDATDDWIAARAGSGDIVITADIPLADRCLKSGASVLGPTGRPFTESSIGMTLATRAIMADLRAGGEQIGGPKAIGPADRSRFLSALDDLVVRLRRPKPRVIPPASF
ncbi:MAG TPA: YaiI/YqxD family protein [Stellaceae bacterium]|nr:YaiI/YqxD family protein [Stellaceae bacterium]